MYVTFYKRVIAYLTLKTQKSKTQYNLLNINEITP